MWLKVIRLCSLYHLHDLFILNKLIGYMESINNNGINLKSQLVLEIMY